MASQNKIKNIRTMPGLRMLCTKTTIKSNDKWRKWIWEENDRMNSMGKSEELAAHAVDPCGSPAYATNADRQAGRSVSWSVSVASRHHTTGHEVYWVRIVLLCRATVFLISANRFASICQTVATHLWRQCNAAKRCEVPVWCEHNTLIFSEFVLQMFLGYGCL